MLRSLGSKLLEVEDLTSISPGCFSFDNNAGLLTHMYYRTIYLDKLL